MGMSMNIKTLLTILFGSSIAVANITAAKIAGIPLPILGTVGVPAGFIAFGFAFLMSDLLTEFYGEDYATDVVNATVVALGAAYALVWVAVGLPAAAFYDATAYNQVLGGSASVVAASIITLAVSQRFDVWLFARVRELTGVGHRYARNIVSTGASQVVDTAVFITLAFAVFPALQGGDPMWGVPLVMTIVGQYLAKLVVAVADTPVFYAVTSIVHRHS